MFTLTEAGSRITCEVMQLFHDTLHLGMMSFLVLSIGLLIRSCLFTFGIDNICIILDSLDILSILAITLVCQ